MRGIALFAAVLTLALLVIPMIALNFEVEPLQAFDSVQPHTPDMPQQSRSEGTSKPAVTPNPPAGETEPTATESDETDTGEESDGITLYGVASFRILDESSGKVLTVSLRDYVRGAVAAEMPANFHPEALKAQAVAAHTYALHNHIIQLQTPDPALKGADFSADPDNMKVFITEETAREFYGDMADVYWNKICDAADEVVSYILEYEDEPIVAAYHAISAGRTEDAANVWSGEAPYLLSADSSGDLLAPDYETVLTIPQDEVQRMLLSAYPDMDLSGEPEIWFSDEERSEAGYITGLDVGGIWLHGQDIRTLFDLRSHNMEIDYNAGQFSFIVYGYGHGVGLSQYGADFMARQGATFDEILENYYTGVTLRQITV